MKLNTIIFDLDGTISDTIKLTTYAIGETVRLHTGKIMSDKDILDHFGPVDTDIVKNLAQNTEEKIVVEEYLNIFTKNFESFVKPIEGIEELLAFIKNKGIKIGLFTGRGRQTADIVINKLGLRHYFDEFMSGEDAVASKPDPDGINKMLSRLGEKPRYSAYVGDFDVDVLASRNAGTMAILALWSSSANEKLLDLKPDAAFKSPYEFIDWLKVRL